MYIYIYWLYHKLSVHCCTILLYNFEHVKTQFVADDCIRKERNFVKHHVEVIYIHAYIYIYVNIHTYRQTDIRIYIYFMVITATGLEPPSLTAIYLVQNIYIYIYTHMYVCLTLTSSFFLSLTMEGNELKVGINSMSIGPNATSKPHQTWQNPVNTRKPS